MKIQLMTLLTALLLTNLCFGQERADSHQSIVIRPTSSASSALFVLKAGTKSYQSKANKEDEISLESLDARWVESISVLKGNDALALYGEKGRDGVVIIRLKDHTAIPQALRNKFRETP